jgi:heme/copper-type cytochrome/quinol oxidase subunit 4
VGVNGLPQALLWIFALIKAAVVLWFFMHIRRLFDNEGGH